MLAANGWHSYALVAREDAGFCVHISWNKATKTIEEDTGEYPPSVDGVIDAVTADKPKTDP